MFETDFKFKLISKNGNYVWKNQKENKNINFLFVLISCKGTDFEFAR